MTPLPPAGYQAKLSTRPESKRRRRTGFFQFEPSTLSTHLAVLRRAGVVTGRRDGSSVIYALADPAVAGFLAAARMFLMRSLARGSDLLADLESEVADPSSADASGAILPRPAASSGPASGVAASVAVAASPVPS